MLSTSRRYEENLKTELIKKLGYLFEEDEIKEVLNEIYAFDPMLQQKILALCVYLSKISAKLVHRVLKNAKEASCYLPLNEMERWLGNAFDLLDSKGLEAAITFLSRTDKTSLGIFHHMKGVALERIVPRLEIYIRGISGIDLKIKPEKECYTDTSIIYLPSSISRFRDPEKNFLLYKLMVTYKWAQIAYGTFFPNSKAGRFWDIETLFNIFPEKALALDLYNVLEALRIEHFLQRQLPGLIRQADYIKPEIFEERAYLDSHSEKTAFVEGLYQYYLKGRTKGPLQKKLKSALKILPIYKQKERPDTETLLKLYEMASDLEGNYLPIIPVPFLGTIKPEKVSQCLRSKREALKKNLRGIITKLIKTPEFKLRMKHHNKAISHKRPIRTERSYLLVKGVLIELDEETGELMKETDGIPGILLEGSEIGGGGCSIEMKELLKGEEESHGVPLGGIKYDEWDYKRGGYRKHWCSLFELDVHPSPEPFVELTLKRYSGYVNTLRKKFELLRRAPKILKRQEDGENIDIDATVEAFADLHAGVSPRENLFTKLERHERNIAVMFLIDMSGSTKGRVNQTEKEALVLMCEALEALKDRYGIYGFSGMTSNRCDFYRVKGFDEPYSDEVKKRIAGIMPKEYTRMGPPIRHATRILKSIEARIKLLVTLSDGKPEDYEAYYKGDYGIEDTRKALIEAKQRGIHSFCVTIDREASSYLPHMYGEVSYIVIDDIWKLPNKITEIYRRLTT